MISPDSHFNTISIISFSLFLSNAQFHTPHHHQGPIALSRYTNKCTNARESKSVRTKAADNYIPTLQYVSITLSLSLSLSCTYSWVFAYARYSHTYTSILLIVLTLYIIPIHTYTQKRIFCLSLSLYLDMYLT